MSPDAQRVSQDNEISQIIARKHSPRVSKPTEAEVVAKAHEEFRKKHPFINYNTNTTSAATKEIVDKNKVGL